MRAPGAAAAAVGQCPRGRTHSPPALVRLLGAAAAGVAVGTVLREEAPGRVGRPGGAPDAAPRLAGLPGSAGLRVAVNALLHRHGAGALRVLLRAPAPAQGCKREKPSEQQGKSLKSPTALPNPVIVYSLDVLSPHLRASTHYPLD